MWNRDVEVLYVEEHFKLNASSLTPGKPKVNPQFFYILKMKNVVKEYKGTKFHFKKLVKEITVYYKLPSNVAKEDINTFVSLFVFTSANVNNNKLINTIFSGSKALQKRRVGYKRQRNQPDIFQNDQCRALRRVHGEDSLHRSEIQWSIW